MELTVGKATETFGSPEMFGNTGDRGEGELMAVWVVPNDRVDILGRSWLVFLGASGPLFIFTPGPDTSWEAVEAAARALV